MSGTKSQPLWLQTSFISFSYSCVTFCRGLTDHGHSTLFFSSVFFLFAFSSLVVSNVVCVNSNILPSVMSYGLMNFLRGAFISLMVFWSQCFILILSENFYYLLAYIVHLFLQFLFWLLQATCQDQFWLWHSFSLFDLFAFLCAWWFSGERQELIVSGTGAAVSSF